MKRDIRLWLPAMALAALSAITGCGKGDPAGESDNAQGTIAVGLFAKGTAHRPEGRHALKADSRLQSNSQSANNSNNPNNSDNPNISNNSEGGNLRPYSEFRGNLHDTFNDSNYLQYAAAERLGIDPIHTLYDAYNTRRPLVKITSGEHYQVDNLTHSMPYLVPEAALLLQEIGDEFGNKLEQRGGDRNNNKIIVTSVLRTPHTVKRLRRVNRNAVDSSTHTFGTTFDISWSHFHSPDSTRSVDAGVLKGILAEVLLEKRQQGRCLVKYERKTPCFHITTK